MTPDLRSDFALGQAGVFRVSSELLIRGMDTWLPSVDFGSDLMTGHGCRLQVKAAKLSVQENSKSYWFALAKRRQRANQDKPDYYVLWGSEENRFWIVPYERLAGKMSCAISSRRANARSTKLAREFEKYEENWKALCVRQMCPQHVLDGQAGVHRVVSELLLRGIHVTIPAVDIGFDLVAGDSVRVQVKSARLGFHQRNWKKVYRFNLNTSLGHHDSPKRRAIRYSDSFQFFAFWGIGDRSSGAKDRFWIVPADKLDGRDRVFFDPEPQRGWVEPDIVKNLRERGKTYKEISRQLSISPMTAWRKINQKEKGKFERTSELRLYEDCWDLIRDLPKREASKGGLSAETLAVQTVLETRSPINAGKPFEDALQSQ